MTPLDELLYDRFGGKSYFIFNPVSFSTPISVKYSQFNKSYDNPMMNESYRNEVLSAFSKIQRFIHAIYRLRTIWRVRRAKWYNTDDLFMNPIQSTDKHIMVIFENNTKYLFQIRELIHVIQTSLSHCLHFFPTPLHCKNPYTNLPFHKSTLYDIYFAIRRSYYAMPVLFEAYFQTNFHFNDFWNKNEELINDEYLKTYVENNCVESVLEDVLDMFTDRGFRISIHQQFPKDVLFKIMKPYLSIFFESHYSLNIHRRAKTKRILHSKLQRFVEFNPSFGRKKAAFVSDNPYTPIKKCVYTFNEDYLPFQKSRTDDFLSNHLDNVQHTVDFEMESASSQETDDVVSETEEESVELNEAPSDDDEQD